MNGASPGVQHSRPHAGISEPGSAACAHPVPQERSAPKKAQLLAALTHAREPALARRALELALDPDVRTQVPVCCVLFWHAALYVS